MDERTDLLDHEHIRVAVTDADRPGAENVPARRIRNNQWLLLRSPLYAMGVAAGDGCVRDRRFVAYCPGAACLGGAPVAGKVGGALAGRGVAGAAAVAAEF